MAQDTAPKPESPADGPDRPERRGAPTLGAPSDPALAAALDAFGRGDYHTASLEAPTAVDDVDDDRAWLARLHRALTWEPTLWITVAVCGALWLWAFTSAQPS